MAIIHVIIPCYNVEKYLEQAVYSVLNQPSKEIDIVLVDDGSPGTTPQLCDEIAAQESRVYVVHKKNGGLSDARNAGIEFVLANLLQGGREFIGFLDGDDIWAPGVIDKDVARHLLTDWDEDVIGFSGVLGNNSLTRYSNKLSTLETADADARLMMWNAQYVTVAAKLYAVDVFKEWNVRFQYKQLYTEDKIFILQFYFLAKKARFINKTLHVYRKNQTGIMSSTLKLSAQNHYLPIIDGWLKCDEFLNTLTDRTHCRSVAGQTLAVTYLVEMVAEHIEKGGKLKDIQEILKKHPHYPAVENGELIRSSSKVYSMNRLLFEHPGVFTAKYRLIGLLKNAAMKLLSIPLVANLYEKHRYPFTEIPE